LPNELVSLYTVSEEQGDGWSLKLLTTLETPYNAREFGFNTVTVLVAVSTAGRDA